MSDRLTLEKYGCLWNPITDPAVIEMTMIRHGGQWTKKDGRLAGNGLFYHYRALQSLLWPEDDHHRWSDLMLKEFLQNTITAVLGPKDSSKTHTMTKFGLTDYFVFPNETLIMISSTDLRGLEYRVWGDLKTMFQRAKSRYDWLPGFLIDSKHAICTQNIKEDDVRDMRKGIVTIPCLSSSGQFVGLGKYVGIKQKRRRLLGDECSLMRSSYLDSLANLNSGDFKGIFVGNPIGENDPLDKISEPKDGWDSVGLPMKTMVWENRFANGRTVNLVGIDSPNFDYPQEPQPRYQYLINQKEIDKVVKFYQKDSMQYFSQCLGVNVAAALAQFSVEAVPGAPNASGTSEIPSGRAMDYFMGRLWVQVSNRTYAAGDISFKGAVPYNRQSFLQFTENAYLAGGGTFNIPSQGGNIRAIFSSSNMDTALGQGELYIGSNEAIYGITVPVDRIAWGAVDNESHMPLQRVVQIRYGPISDRSIVKVNGDVFYQAYDGIRSLQIAIRYFHQWGQLPISRNENRALQFNDRTFYRFASGIEFDNRLLQTVLPFQTARGVAHRGLLPLDFDILNSLDNREAPAWEGILEGLDIMQVVETSFGGRQRAFAVICSRETGMIEFWELTDYSKFDNDDTRISYYVETPAYTWQDVFKLKELDSGELWFDRVFGTVTVTVEYRQDQNPCWNFWKSFEFCSARSTCEDVVNPVCYPEQPYDECYKVPLVLPKPPINCDACNLRPSNHAYQFQFRITVKGFARLRSCIWYALPRMRQPYSGLVC